MACARKSFLDYVGFATTVTEKLLVFINSMMANGSVAHAKEAISVSTFNLICSFCMIVVNCDHSPEEFRTQGLGTGEKVIFARNTGCIQTGLATKNILEEVDVGKSGNSSSPLSDWQLRTKIALGSRGLSSFCTSH
ncbi:hypothetical protein CUMW_225930 [Citrus unshiu]|uniref:Uncharacterized protein n=1 Tax=Citrus unshiu TaxID=55188 RepID=A0A2H5QFR6_CITUN|nr:hypothetical protein CUMW_225930 [Citrus unshiu]